MVSGLICRVDYLDQFWDLPVESTLKISFETKVRHQLYKSVSIETDPQISFGTYLENQLCRLVPKLICKPNFISISCYFVYFSFRRSKLNFRGTPFEQRRLNGFMSIESKHNAFKLF